MKIFKYFSAFFLVVLFSTSFVSAETQTLSPFQRISLKFYCFTAPLFGSDTSRCDEKLQGGSEVFSAPSTSSSLKTSPTSSVENRGVTNTQVTSTSSEVKIVTEKIIEQPIYITRYVSTPGPKGEKGEQGEPGVTKTVSSTSNSNPYSNTFSSNTYAGAQYGGYFAPAVNTSSQLVGVSTVGYLNGATSENTLLKATTTVEGILNVSAATTFYSSPLFTQGFTSSATSTFNGPSFFNGHATFASLPSMPLAYGALLVGGSNNKATPLTPGTLNQILTVNASGTPEWTPRANLMGLTVTGTTTFEGPVNINTTGTSTTTIGNASSSIVLVAGTLTSATSSFATSTIGSLILGTTTAATTTDEILMRDLTTGEVKSLAASNFLLAATTNSATTSSNTLTSTVNGVTATTTLITSNVLTSLANTLTSTVNGITSTAVNLINSFTQTLSGNTLTTTINGVTATSSVISSNTLAVATTTNDVIISSDINGVLATTTFSAVNSNVATSTGNFLSTIVNGVSSGLASIINSFTQTLSGNTLTTTINGVTATSSVVSSNGLDVTGTNLTSTVNGIATTTDLKNLVASSTDNALSFTGNVLTSAVNGKVATSTIIDTSAATSSANLLTTIINGITSSAANIINSFTQTLAGNTLTTTINGVTATSSVISSNAVSLATSTGLLTSTINGVVATSSLGLIDGQVVFGNSTNGLSQSSNLFWDNVNGRLGVGTTTPTSQFSVAGNSSSDPALYVYNTSNSNGSPAAIFRGGAGNAGFANFEVQNQDGTSALAIEGTGALWLGGINAGASLFYSSGDLNLHSNRSLTITSGHNPVLSLNGFTVQNTGLALQFDGDITATSYTNSSDARLKKDVSTTTSSLDKIHSLRPVDFKWISASSSQTLQHGFIAQEVEAVMPELVVTKQDGYKAVNYMNLISVLTGGVQDLDGKIETGFVSVSPESLASWTQAGAITTLTDSVKNEAPRNALAYITEKMTAGYKAISDFSALRITAIAGYFENIFAKQVHTEKVCLGTPGNETCITKGDLDKMLSEKTVSSSNSGSAAGDSSNSSSSTPTSTSTPASDSSATTTPAETPSSPEETTPAETSTPVESPAAESVPQSTGE